MATADQLTELADQRVDLGGRQAAVGVVDEPGVEAELAEQG